MSSRLLACGVFASFLSLASAAPICVISTRINVGKEPIDMAPVTTTFGAPADQELIQTCTFPTGWTLPKHLSDIAAVPMFPSTFDKQKVGWQIRYTVERTDKYIVLHGKATYTAVATLPHGVYGEESGPITAQIMKNGQSKPEVICDNQTHNFSFQATTTHFQIVALPGKTYTVQLQHGAETVDATITCALQINGQPVALARDAAKN